MGENIILLSDHTWYAVCDKEQAQKFVNNHKWGDLPFAYGIYIEPKYQTLLYKDLCKEEER